MINMTLSQAANCTHGELFSAHGDEQLTFSNVATDTRSPMPQSLFIALKGDNFNAHQYLDQAQAQGAVACLLDETVETSLPVISVKDTGLAMGELASYVRDDLALPCIGVTGSCGKTTVKEMIACILQVKGKVLSTRGNFNNAVGVPLTLFRLSKDDQFAVIEMGASQVGDIDELGQWVKPNVALITNVSEAHLLGLGSLDGVARVKGEILNHLASDGTAILNYESDYLTQWSNQLSEHQNTKTFSVNDCGADYYASDIIQTEEGGLEFIAHTSEGTQAIQCSVTGLHNVGNAMSAIAAAIAVGANLEECKEGLANMKAVKGRMEILKGLFGSRVINDSYNANPASLKVAMQALMNFEGQHLLILGDMAELGEGASKAHYEAGKNAKNLGINTLYAVGELSLNAVEGFGEGAQHFDSKETLATAVEQKLQQSAYQDWSLLIKGSRSAAMEELLVQLVEQPQTTGTPTCS